MSKNPTASIEIKEGVEISFNKVRDEMLRRFPWTEPSNADVVRYALYETASRGDGSLQQCDPAFDFSGVSDKSER